MSHQTERQSLDQLLALARRRFFWKSFFSCLASLSLWAIPVMAGAVGIMRRWFESGQAGWVLLGGAGVLLAAPALWASLRLGGKGRAALVLDEEAGLKDRVSSAYEFLAGGPLDEPRALQVKDAIRRAESLGDHAMFRVRMPRSAVFLPVVLLLLLGSFFVPPAAGPRNAMAADDLIKAAQLEELKNLQAVLEEQPSPEVLELLEKLKSVRERFEEGELSEREVMLELARLDEDMRQKANELGAENLEGEMNVIVPHLMSSASSQQLASALKERDLEKAREELNKLKENVKKNALGKEEKRELSLKMGVAAAKLGGKQKTSFGGDFAKASEALEGDDTEGFESACESMGDKLDLLKKAKAMKLAAKKLGACKACLGQCSSKEQGYTEAPKSKSKSKGGLKAGAGASGDPFGEKSRLEEGYRNMVRISGQAGQGPVESETEVTEGQMSASQVGMKEMFAEFEAVAEEAIENESIPLRHRYHVKRYFQAIRPKE